jgi:hypothetical protein
MKPLFLDHQRLYLLSSVRRRTQHGAFELIVALLLALIVIPTVTAVTIRQLNQANHLHKILAVTAIKTSWDKEKLEQSSCSSVGSIGSTKLILCRYGNELPEDQFILAVE